MAEISKESNDVGDNNRKVSSKSSESQRDVFSYHTNQLRGRTRILRFLGFCIFGFSLFGLVSSMLSQATVAYFTKDAADIARVATITVAIMAMCFIVAYEYQRRVGRALFEEMSDEFQWRKHGEVGDVSREEESDESAPLDARVALREFARTIDLPLIPGRFGPAIYMVVNIAVIVTAIII